MISNILAHQRADHGMMYNNNNNRDSSIGIFGNLREQIFNLQKDLHVERHSSNVREMVISSMAAKIGILEEELNKSEGVITASIDPNLSKKLRSIIPSLKSD